MLDPPQTADCRLQTADCRGILVGRVTHSRMYGASTRRGLFDSWSTFSLRIIRNVWGRCSSSTRRGSSSRVGTELDSTGVGERSAYSSVSHSRFALVRSFATAGWEVMKPWLKKYSGLVRFVSADEVRQDYFTSESVPADFSKEPFLTGKRE